MSALTSVFAQGTHASRPAAASTNNGWMYFETDTVTLFQSNGSTWVQLAPAATSGSGVTPYNCRVRNSANISIGTGSFTALTYDTETFDNDTMHSTVTNTGRITFTHAGVYLVSANIQFAAAAGGSNRAMKIRIGGTTDLCEVNVQPATSTSTSLYVASLYSASAADYAECLVFQDSGGNLNVNTQSDWSPVFSAARVG